MLGFVLVIVVFGVCDANRPEGKGFAPLVIGLAIALGHLASVSLVLKFHNHNIYKLHLCPSAYD